MTPIDVVVVGSLNLDLVATAPRHPRPGETVAGSDYQEYPGGKGLNQAVAAARAGATVAMIGCVGDDEAGRRLRRVAHDEGIDTAGIRTVDATPTGRAVIVVDDGGENSIVVVPGANASVEARDLDLPQSRVVLAQLEIPLPVVGEAFRRAARAGAVTVLDPAPAAALPPDLVASCRLVIPNEHEVELAGGARRLLADGAERVVVTRGAAGVEVYEQRDRSLPRRADDVAPSHRHEVFPVHVVDTTGAGDAFRGSLAARLAAGDPIESAVRFATAAGALATTRAGAVPSLPRLAEIEALAGSVEPA